MAHGGQRGTSVQHDPQLVQEFVAQSLEHLGDVEPLVLDREKVSRVHEKILKAYGIDEDRFLREAE